MERWNKTPSQWDSLIEEDRAQILAFIQTQADMAAYENYLAEKQRIAAEARANIQAEVSRGKR